MDFISLEGDRASVCILKDAQAAAKHFQTIGYEITTALSAAIAREVI
jgi:hypothetical protein